MFTATFFLLAFVAGETPKPIPEPLWPNGVPNVRKDGKGNTPTLTFYHPSAEKSNGTGVVVCPGGGYGGLADDHEGRQPAAWLTARGITAIVLHYRVAPYKHPEPLRDAQRALRTVRSRAATLKIDPKRIGIWGFSAGGHLASSAATHFDDGDPQADDPVSRVSCRPDFAILCYPVITFTEPFVHAGSRANLIGNPPPAALIELLSNEKQVTAKTPPTFLFHTDNDTVVLPENSVMFYLALRKAKVPAELHVYSGEGPHGVGLAQQYPNLLSWPDRLATWLKIRGFLQISK